MMGEEQTPSEQAHKDFLISYASPDRTWAEWMAATLEEGGYRTIIAAWDVRPGENVVLAMNEATKRADRTLLVLSEAYLVDATVSEWTVAFGRDPQGRDGWVVPVRIDRCAVEGLLSSLVCVDLVDLSEQEARECLLAGVNRERAKPDNTPFPVSSSLVPLDRVIFPPTLPAIWNVPYPQNALFTGREELLTQLESTLQSGQPTALLQPQAISGLGGIGKTQLVLEYAYRHRHEYHAVLWAQAETREALTSPYLSIARLLDLPEKDVSESERVIVAVKRWLQRQTGWLLVLDNADELTLVRDFLPPSVSGHVLLTTRAQAMGRFARRVEMDVLPTEVGALFLLRRAGLLALDTAFEQAEAVQRDQACAICEQLGGLPLALDQAGAYIEEMGCGQARYVQLYQQRRSELLRKRGGLVDDHPESVATTWLLAFEQVERKNLAAADLLRLCACLAPSTIPLEIITEGARHLGEELGPAAADLLALEQAIKALRAYSLAQRDTQTGALVVHRLVQAVIQEGMMEETRRTWKERVVRAVDAALPVVEFKHWVMYEWCMPHAFVCARWIEQEQMRFPAAAWLLNMAGLYLSVRGRYREAKPLLQHALPTGCATRYTFG
jgi:hypothetical protein